MHPLRSTFGKFSSSFQRQTRESNVSDYKGRKIGIGCAITTRNVASERHMNQFLPFFLRLLPSFCKTASVNYSYTYFIGYDFNDKILSTIPGRKMFISSFDELTKSRCKGDFVVGLRFVECSHAGQPARAQNDALMAAYRANMDYLYMVNDDTRMITPKWTELLINQLAQFHPPNVGLVGPMYKEGNIVDLTYNFVHRTHVDIFKCFYPHMFTDWYADQWISRVYLPNNVRKVYGVRISHTMDMGTRYGIRQELEKWLIPLIIRYRQFYLRKYLEDRKVDWVDWSKYKRQVQLVQ